jgi:hypothetical protein
MGEVKMNYTNKDILVAEMKNLEFDHKHESEGQRCGLCWELHCNHNYDIENDPFLSLNDEVDYINDLQYA